jgi:hypothetical protein
MLPDFCRDPNSGHYGCTTNVFTQYFKHIAFWDGHENVETTPRCDSIAYHALYRAEQSSYAFSCRRKQRRLKMHKNVARKGQTKRLVDYLYVAVTSKSFRLCRMLPTRATFGPGVVSSLTLAPPRIHRNQRRMLLIPQLQLLLLLNPRRMHCKGRCLYKRAACTR